MLFLLLRFLPYIIPALFFALTKAVFYYSNYWYWFFGGILAVSLLYFILLKYKNRDKPVIWLCLFALIYTVAGFAYSLILENPLVINAYLIVWSLFYWLYLEAVFHDFYETAKTFIFNLQNITLYGNILIIFFLTAALANFNIFLDLSWLTLLLLLAAAYFCLVYLAFIRQGRGKSEAGIYAGIIALILTEILGGLLMWPSSFYVIAIIISLCYYLLMSLSLLSLLDKLIRKSLIQYLVFSVLILAAVLFTATWL
jgi:hypothetical protein